MPKYDTQARKVAEALRGTKIITTEQELIEAFEGELPDNSYIHSFLRQIDAGEVIELNHMDIFFIAYTRPT